MLGLSNENPLYVKFALDFGLVGRTGQDLGLTWRPPTLAKGGWNAMIGGLGASPKNSGDSNQKEDPTAKPLLRILPTGPAHQVLRMFRNRTLYSNVVNDGIVPLRTSCLLFLDWRGLGKVEKARRENGLIGTMAEWGWAELTGANSSNLAPNVIAERVDNNEDDEADNEHVRHGEGETVPQPAEDETAEDSKRLTHRMSYDEGDGEATPNGGSMVPSSNKPSQQSEKGVFDTFFDFFRPCSAAPDRAPKPPPHPSKKTTKAIRRAQTLQPGEDELPEDIAEGMEGTTSNPTMRPHMSHPHLPQAHQSSKRPVATRGDSIASNHNGDVHAPPKTSIFESAGDILHPPLPSRQWITDPASRSRTIFHDRVYHPEDIPPPPLKRPASRLTRSFSSDASSKFSQSSGNSGASMESTDSGAMKVEEKIARAYHRNLSWRKVLVRLEPDAHNNMIVRRMFANAYGWPVVKHLCDTHFADTYTATTRDEDEPARERAPPMDQKVHPDNGEEVMDQTAKQVPERTQSETREARDELADLDVSRSSKAGASSQPKRPGAVERTESAVWDDSYLEGSDGDDSDVDERHLVQRLVNPMGPKKPEPIHPPSSSSRRSEGIPKTPVTSYTDGHRGLTPISPSTPRDTGSFALAKPISDPTAEDRPVVADRIVDEPEPLEDSPGSTSELGLRKSVADQVSPTKPKAQK